MITQYPYQSRPKALEVYTDTDHAGCIKTRRSTNGGFIMHGRHIIKSWSSTQATVALSSGESEYYGLIKGAAEGLGLQAVLQEGGAMLEVRLCTDSSAAKGMAERLGLNKRTRHIAVHYLWLQEAVEGGRVTIRKVPGKQNPADIGTKYLAYEPLMQCCTRVGLESAHEGDVHSLRTSRARKRLR